MIAEIHALIKILSVCLQDFPMRYALAALKAFLLTIFVHGTATKYIHSGSFKVCIWILCVYAPEAPDPMKKLNFLYIDTIHFKAIEGKNSLVPLEKSTYHKTKALVNSLYFLMIKVSLVVKFTFLPWGFHSLLFKKNESIIE